MSFLRNSVSSLLSSLQRAGGESILYHVGDLELSITGVRGESEFLSEQYAGQFEHSKSADWILKATDLNVVGEIVEPSEGDLIQTESDEFFEVQPMANQTVWSWVDPYKTIIRVHSILRETLIDESYS